MNKLKQYWVVCEFKSTQEEESRPASSRLTFLIKATNKRCMEVKRVGAEQNWRGQTTAILPPILALSRIHVYQSFSVALSHLRLRVLALLQSVFVFVFSCIFALFLLLPSFLKAFDTHRHSILNFFETYSWEVFRLKFFILTKK